MKNCSKKTEVSKKIFCSKTLSLGEVIMYLGHVEYKLPLHLQMLLILYNFEIISLLQRILASLLRPSSDMRLHNLTYKIYKLDCVTKDTGRKLCILSSFTTLNLRPVFQLFNPTKLPFQITPPGKKVFNPFLPDQHSSGFYSV